MLLKPITGIVGTIYDIECFSPEGELKWAEHVHNLITTEGFNDLLTKYFKGSTYTAAWYVGLIDNAGFSAIAAGDTAAQINGSNGWAELSEYDEAIRQTLTLGTAASGSIDNASNKAVFTMSATVTVNGVFIASTSTVDGTTGVLYSAASFGSTRAVVDNDIINVTATLSFQNPA